MSGFTKYISQSFRGENTLERITRRALHEGFYVNPGRFEEFDPCVMANRDFSEGPRFIQSHVIACFAFMMKGFLLLP